MVNFKSYNKTINSELEAFSNDKKDFEYRRLFITINEIRLKSIRLKILFFKLTTLSCFILTLLSINTNVISLTLNSLTLISFIILVYLKRKYKRIFIKFLMVLDIVDSVIKKEHGITMTPYL